MKKYINHNSFTKGLLSLAVFVASISASYFAKNNSVYTDAFKDRQKWSQELYQKVTQTDFRKHKLFNALVDLEKPDRPRLNAAIFYITNEKRAEANMPLLSYHPKLEQMATMHSDDMLHYEFFSHTNPKNKKRAKVKDRAVEVNISNPLVAENIYLVSGKEERTYLNLADKIVTAWMDSPPHRANVLHKSALELGCGGSYTSGSWKKENKKKANSVKGYWLVTQNFQFYKKIDE